MPLTFANSWAALSLLIPAAVLAIHFLQRKHKKYQVSTLFLLEHVTSVGRRGSALSWIRNSTSLWLQLLAAFLLAAVIAKPRLIDSEQVVQIVFVLDDSASMSAFLPEAKDAVLDVFDQSSAYSATDTVFLYSSGVRSPRRVGQERTALLKTLEEWAPARPSHDPQKALERAQRVAGSKSRVVFVTDHPVSVPEQIELLSVGKPIVNAGFCGSRTDTTDEKTSWQALLHNPSPVAVTRKWRMLGEGKSGEEREVRLKPEAFLHLKGEFPEGVKSFEIRLSGDDFALDDRAFFILPEQPVLRLHADKNLPPLARQFFQNLCASLNNTAMTPTPSEARLLAYAGTTPDTRFSLPVFLLAKPEQTTPVSPLRGIATEPHPLTEGLDFSRLLFAHQPATAPTDSLPLAWSKTFPVLALFGQTNTPSLFLGIPAEQSNFFDLPATVLLTRRWIEIHRKTLPGFRSGIFDCLQEIILPVESSDELKVEGGARLIRMEDGFVWMEAPPSPGFFRVYAGGKELLRGAACFRFADEADFQRAAARKLKTSASEHAVAQSGISDPFSPILILLAALLMLVDWRLFSGSRSS